MTAPSFIITIKDPTDPSIPAKEYDLISFDLVAKERPVLPPPPPPQLKPIPKFTYKTRVATATIFDIDLDATPTIPVPGTTISSYAWSWPNKNARTGVKANYAGVAGTYNVTLTVVDSAGNTASAAQQVIVP